MSRLLVDITELVTWRGKLTGVPRVMNELSIRFAADPEVHFVAWSKHGECLYNVDFQPIDPDAHISLEPVDAPASLSETAKKVIRKSRLASRSVEVAKHNAVRLLETKRRLLDKPTPIDFAPGDTLFIMADWHGSDPNYITYITALQQAGIALAQICYDLLPVVAPQYSGHATKTFKKYIEATYPISDVIIAISKHTKRDIEQWFERGNRKLPPVAVMRLGDDFRLTRTVKPTAKEFLKYYGNDEDYFLSVGTVEARKNHTVLYYAYKLAAERGITLPRLFIVGRRGWLAHDIYEIIANDPATKDKIVFLEGIADNELAWLYEHCISTVYASFYEGWGLPVAESMAYGVPCVCSGVSSMPEIAGDLVRYFSPFDPADCLAALQYVIDDTHHEQLVRAIRKYHKTTWDETFTAVSNALKETKYE